MRWWTKAIGAWPSRERSMTSGADELNARLALVANAHGEAGQPDATLRALDAALAGAPGYILFTVLLHRPALREQERCYSSNPGSYPVGGRKPVTDSPWMQRLLVRGDPWLGPTFADVREAFYDHELIASLGCGSVLNLPVRWRGDTLAVLNLLHRERHYSEADIRPAWTLAQLALPAVLMLTPA